jgi:hypothetical protein
MSNIPTPEQIAAGTATLKEVPLDVMQAILSTIDERSKVLASAKKTITSTVAERVNADITAAYIAKGVDTGIVHIDRDGLDVQVDRSKTVTWDQAILVQVHASMVAAGDDPTEYMTTTHTVSEAAYGAWPSMIKRVFEPARTVKPGSPSIKLVTPVAKAA